MKGDYPERRGRNGRSEQAATAARSDQGEQMSDQEVPEPDAAEQAQPVADVPGFMEVSSDPEAPAADAYEQAIEEPVDEEESLR
jgi:hypothetical protein